MNQISEWPVRWLLFFLICLGLGYASVQRYDPRATAGLSDALVYVRMVAGEDVQARELRSRVLVPWVAKPFYAVCRKYLDGSRAVALALLISNAIFGATSGCLLVALGLRITGHLATALLGATLYLLNFAVINLQLAGLVDAGEACLILAVVLTLLGSRWWCLPVWGLLGALAKETFLPLAGVLALVWWCVEFRRSQKKFRKLAPIVALVAVAVATTLLLRSTVTGSFSISALLAPTHASGAFAGMPGMVLSPTFWYVFVWLLPLGVIRLKRLPRPWILASSCSALMALVLGMYRDIGGNVARPLFDVLGPILSLSAAMFLTGFSKQSTPESPN